MAPNKLFENVVITSFNCTNCITNLVCRGKKNKESKSEKCKKCESEHIRCLSSKCVNCCQRNKCNGRPCPYCIDNNLECKRTLPITQDEFNQLNEVSYIVHQDERTENGRFHSQAYVQLTKRMNQKRIKEIFGDNTISIEKAFGNSNEAISYCKKIYNRCKIEHEKECKCDYFDVDIICDNCLDDCKQLRTLARWDKTNLSDDYPYEFGKPREHRRLLEVIKTKKEFEDKKILQYENVVMYNETQKKIQYIIDNEIQTDELLRNPELIAKSLVSSWINLSQYNRDKLNLKIKDEMLNRQSEYTLDDFNIPQDIQEWYNENIKTKPSRPKSLILIGETGTGKTSMMRLFGKHVYWLEQKNLNLWSDDAEYIIFDDFKWIYRRGEYFSNRFDSFKAFIGCQKDISTSCKYLPKVLLKGGIPSIFICNPDQNPLDSIDNQNFMRYVEKNCKIVYLDDNWKLIKKDKGKKRMIEEITEDDCNTDCSDYETGVENNNSKKRKIEQSVENNQGESSQRIGDELEQLEVEIAIQSSLLNE